MSRATEIYQARLRQGLCPKCGGPRDNETLRCTACREHHKEASKRYYDSSLHAQQKQTRLREQGLCTRCGQSNDTTGALCSICNPKNNARNREARQQNPTQVRSRENANYQRVRKAAIDAYGGSCICCGEDYYPYLQLDHINGGGTQHRKAWGIGAKFYYRLANDGYPPILQVLCANCHQAKTVKTVCKHSCMVA